LPVIALRLISTNSTRLEIGGNEFLNEYTFGLDIFATSEAQRLDLSDFIVNALKNGWQYYDYSQASGNPTTLDKVANGRCMLLKFNENSRLDFDGDVDKYDLHRSYIGFTVRKSI
jgi:hypothetical protein